MKLRKTIDMSKKAQENPALLVKDLAEILLQEIRHTITKINVIMPQCPVLQSPTFQNNAFLVALKNPENIGAIVATAQQAVKETPTTSTTLAPGTSQTATPALDATKIPVGGLLNFLRNFK